MKGKQRGGDLGQSAARRTGVLARIRRILSREGPAGLISRLRHSYVFQRNGPPPPRLAGGASVVAHDGRAEAAALMRQRFEAPVAGATAANSPSTFHLGAPRRPATAADVVFLCGPGPLPRSVQSAGLIVADDPARIEKLTRAGRHVIAAACPLDDASLRRIEVLTGRLDPRLVDMGAAIRPALTRAVPRLCLTLPEFPSRSQRFQACDRLDMTLVHGLRYHPSWAGAAYSYRQIARALRAAGQTHALVAQDDMESGGDFERRFALAERHVLDTGADMLAGLITDIDVNFRIRRVVRRDGVTLVHLNKGVGLVMNLFGPRALDRVARWDRLPSDANGPMTIDRYLAAAADFEVVVPLPFLVGHHIDARSTIWPFSNGRYRTSIAYSERRLAEMVAVFERGARKSGS